MPEGDPDKIDDFDREKDFGGEGELGVDSPDASDADAGPGFPDRGGCAVGSSKATSNDLTWFVGVLVGVMARRKRQRF